MDRFSMRRSVEAKYRPLINDERIVKMILLRFNQFRVSGRTTARDPGRASYRLSRCSVRIGPDR